MTTPSGSSPAPLNTALGTIASAAAAELDPLWVLNPPDIINSLFDVLPALVDRWALASASAAADWYDELRAAQNVSGRFTAIVQPLDHLGADALAGWGSEPLKAPAEHAPVNLDQPDPVESARSRVEGGLQKRIVNAANLTITDSAEQDPKARGWMRKTRPDACGFCLMVASRGGVYTKATVTFACHEHCFCTGVPVWGGQELPVQPYKPSAKQSTAADRARVRRWIKENLS